eukprot:GHVS01071450.1.p1 GENE.GHVS01071450.1~~GHVS01071450.1.p1  ORF type:complete len:834 (+),score=147.31 GHVS01071450.1:255-2756(+)
MLQPHHHLLRATIKHLHGSLQRSFWLGSSSLSSLPLHLFVNTPHFSFFSFLPSSASSVLFRHISTSTSQRHLNRLIYSQRGRYSLGRCSSLAPYAHSLPSSFLPCPSRHFSASFQPSPPPPRPPSSPPPSRRQSRFRIFAGAETDVLRSLAPYLWPPDTAYRLRVVGSVACLVLSKLATIQAPILLGKLVDALAASSATTTTATAIAAAATTPSAVTTAATGVLGAALSSFPIFTIPSLLVISYVLARTSASAFGELRNALFTRVSQSACRIIACHAFRHLHSLDLDYLLSAKAGELSTIIFRGVKSITQLLNMMLFQVVPTLFEFSLVLYVLSSCVGAPVAAITVATMLAYTLFTTKVTSRRTQLRKKMNEAEQHGAGLLLDSLINAEAVRYFTNEQHEAKRYEKEQRKFEKLNVEVNESLAYLNFGQQLIFNSGLLATMFLILSQISAGLVPIGHLVLATSLLFQLAIPLNFVGSVYRETRLNLVDMHKLHELLTLRPKCSNPPDAKLFQFRAGEITFKDVHFDYSAEISKRAAAAGADGSTTMDTSSPTTRIKTEDYTVARKSRSSSSTGGGGLSCSTKSSSLAHHSAPVPIFSGFNLHIPAGHTVAIVGASGSGKTTLVKLLYRLFDPDSGQVIIDGQDVRTLDMESFRRCIGVVPQDVVLFNESVRFNINYGRPAATIEEVREAAVLAQIDDSIMSFPAQYDTVVGERGMKLSGGEKQRICIARCLLRNPGLVVFDEATSSLDAATENRILSAFKAIAKDRTCLVIAHRLSTIVQANQIVYLEDGKVKEIGTHSELLNIAGGSYAKAWFTQISSRGGDIKKKEVSSPS